MHACMHVCSQRLVCCVVSYTNGQVQEESKALHKKAKKEKSELRLGPSSGAVGF